MGRIRQLWRATSLRGKITLVATAFFTIAVLSGALLTLFVVRHSLTDALDNSADRTAHDVAGLVESNDLPNPILANSSGVVEIQVVDAANKVIAYSPGADAAISMVTSKQLADVRVGKRVSSRGQAPIVQDAVRVTGVRVGTKTVLVATDVAPVDQSVAIVRAAAVIGCPLAILAMAVLTYLVVGRTLQSVATLRHGAEDITAAGLSDQRLPVGNADDEIHRLAETLNAMLDRIDTATSRQRTFVGDAAHELRSPLASLRVQLEVAARMGPQTDWDAVISDVLVDADRLDHLVADLLTLARSDESGGKLRREEPVELTTLVEDVVQGYDSARLPVHFEPAHVLVVRGDVDALRRVVVNLVDNALRFARTSVTVTVAPGLGPNGTTAELVVTDDGPGIPAAERERVFDRFYRTESSRSRESGGTGLGLPIVRDLVRAHGGTVRLESNDPGVRAVVSLPTSAPAATVPTAG